MFIVETVSASMQFSSQILIESLNEIIFNKTIHLFKYKENWNFTHGSAFYTKEVFLLLQPIL